MPTFLDLARKVGSESGTVSGNQITSVTASSNDRVRKIVRWVADAYRQIQNVHRGWAWLQNDFEASVPAGAMRLTPAALGVTRFAEWDCTHDGREDRFSLYAVGEQAAEHPLVFQDWRSFYASRLRGVVPEGKPRFFSISPRGEIVLYPKPATDCVLRGPYRMAPQELTVDTDVPEMPAHFHDVIVDGALILLTTHDEGAATLSLYQLRQLRAFSQLEREQLPRISFGGSLA